ncbi:MAG: putative Histidine kinase [Gemmatimonadetes bacterium]|nr:putative Histidine kinase [Gemmatimonadota bacterium]
MPDSQRPVEQQSSKAVGAAAIALAPLLEHVRDGCFFVYYDFTVGFLNAAARRDILSRDDNPGRFPGQNIWTCLGYAADLPARVAIEEAAVERAPISYTTRGTFGSYWVEIDFTPLDEGFLIYYRDATTRSVAEVARASSEAELRVTTERLRVLIDEAPLAVIVVNDEHKVVLWNPAAEAMFQWTAEEVIGGYLPTIPDEEVEALTAMRARLRAGESQRVLPARRRRKDGVIIDVQVSNGVLRDAEGAAIGVIGMITDVTANRKLEVQLRMAQKMEAVGLLAGGVAHDFNNLLTAIKGFTSLLQMTLEESDQANEFLGEINKAADRAAALTAQLLAFSRRQLLRPEALDLNARVRDLDRMLRLLLREDGTLDLDLDPNLNQVLADPGQIEQVILNLVVNARDAIHGITGGRVTISTRNAELLDEFGQWGVEDAPGPYVRLDVADNGTGMDRATQARIFDPFFTTKEPGQGTGLGLATVFGIVKQSGGYVWVHSQPDEGAIFSVYLPRAKSAGRMSGAVNVISGGGTETILLVEDEDAVRRVARRALELHGYSIIEATDGTMALELAAQHDIDIVLTDVMMPGMRGPTLAEELRKRIPGLPVVFMSGHSDEIVREGLLQPSTPFLAKPFTPAQLAHKVREALEGARHAT